METIATQCVDCDKEMSFTGQAMIRCGDCLFNFILDFKLEK